MITLSPETESLALEVASRRGVPVDVAVREALAATAAAVRPARRRMTAAQMLAFADGVADLPLLDHRTPQAILDEVNGP
jgi:antitoxin VapB